MDDDFDTRKLNVESFIQDCKSQFGWSCLPGDVVIDVGCGEHGFCGKAMRECFPETRIIFMDKKPPTLLTLQSDSEMREICEIADIEERKSIRCFEGRMNKVVSTYVFQQLVDKEEGFRNVYRMLKPGGEAALLFVIKNVIDEWLMEMLKIPKWKALHKAQYKDEKYKSKVHCQEFVESIGFKVVECTERQRKVPPTTALKSKEDFYTLTRDFFEVSEEFLNEFKEGSFQVLNQLSVRNTEGKIFYRVTELTLVLVKPA